MHVRFPLELKKQCQASCRVDIRIVGFLSRSHNTVTSAILFSVDPQGICRIIAAESGVSGVDWDIGVFWNGGLTPGVPLEVHVETTSS